VKSDTQKNKTCRITFCLEKVCFLLFLTSCPIHSSLTPCPRLLPCLLLSGPVRGTRVRHSQEVAGQCEKAVCRGWMVGRGSKEGFGNFACASMRGVKKSKAQLELTLVRDVKENNRSF